MQNAGSVSMQTKGDDLATHEGVSLDERNIFLSGNILEKLISVDLHRGLEGFWIRSSACLTRSELLR